MTDREQITLELAQARRELRQIYEKAAKENLSHVHNNLLAMEEELNKE